MAVLWDVVLFQIGWFACVLGAAKGPPWLITLWPNFAATLNVSLRWLQGRYGSAAVLGSLGGSAAYWSGAALGAITILEPLARNLLMFSVSWTAVVPLLLLPGAAIRRRTNRRSQVLGLPEKYCATHYLRPCLNP